MKLEQLTIPFEDLPPVPDVFLAAAAWKAAALEAAEALSKTGKSFTTDDVWLMAGSPKYGAKVSMSAVMGAARRKGWCKATRNYVLGNRSMRPICVWQGLS